MLRLRFLGAVGLLLGIIAPVWAEGPEFPLLRDAQGQIMSSCTITFKEGVTFNVYLSKTGKDGVYEKSMNVPNSAAPALHTMDSPCPVLPAGQYWWRVAGQAVDGTTEGGPSIPSPFMIVDTAPQVPTLALAYSGMLRDRVGMANLAAKPDGTQDATFTVTLTGSAIGKDISGLVLEALDPAGVNIGQWHTAGGPNWTLGMALTLDGALLNDPSTDAVRLAAPGSFVVFAGANQGGYVPGNTYRLTVTFSDGTTMQATAPYIPGATLAAPVTGYQIGAPVTALVLLNVRSAPGSPVIATVGKGAAGVIVDGPQVLNGATWWKVKWSAPLTGWSLQSLLGYVAATQ